jgi:hypothetical protein
MSAKQFSSAGYEVSDLNDHINVASHNIFDCPNIFPSDQLAKLKLT